MPSSIPGGLYISQSTTRDSGTCLGLGTADTPWRADSGSMVASEFDRKLRTNCPGLTRIPGIHTGRGAKRIARNVIHLAGQVTDIHSRGSFALHDLLPAEPHANRRISIE